MNDADRYQREFDLVMQGVEAQARSRTKSERDAAWKRLEPSFTLMADAHGWTKEQREIKKQFYLDAVFADL